MARQKYIVPLDAVIEVFATSDEEAAKLVSHFKVGGTIPAVSGENGGAMAYVMFTGTPQKVDRMPFSSRWDR